jgi:hypothetical protein
MFIANAVLYTILALACNFGFRFVGLITVLFEYGTRVNNILRYVFVSASDEESDGSWHSSRL